MQIRSTTTVAPTKSAKSLTPSSLKLGVNRWISWQYFPATTLMDVCFCFPTGKTRQWRNCVTIWTALIFSANTVAPETNVHSCSTSPVLFSKCQDECNGDKFLKIWNCGSGDTVFIRPHQSRSQILLLIVALIKLASFIISISAPPFGTYISCPSTAPLALRSPQHYSLEAPRVLFLAVRPPVNLEMRPAWAASWRWFAALIRKTVHNQFIQQS